MKIGDTLYHNFSHAGVPQGGWRKLVITHVVGGHVYWVDTTGYVGHDEASSLRDDESYSMDPTPVPPWFEQMCLRLNDRRVR
jgi:hypothetical protein